MRSIVELESVRLCRRDELSHTVTLFRYWRTSEQPTLECAAVLTVGAEHAGFRIIGEPSFEFRGLGVDEELRDAFPEVPVGLVTKLLDVVPTLPRPAPPPTRAQSWPATSLA
jgi:hypothetical protein